MPTANGHSGASRLAWLSLGLVLVASVFGAARVRGAESSRSAMDERAGALAPVSRGGASDNTPGAARIVFLVSNNAQADALAEGLAVMAGVRRPQEFAAPNAAVVVAGADRDPSVIEEIIAIASAPGDSLGLPEVQIVDLRRG